MQGSAVQIIHTRNSHWAVLQITTSNTSTINLYDSAYTSTSKDTVHVIAQLVRTKNHTITVNLMNVAKQTGTVDCALYAMAIITCFALDIDPVTVVFRQEEMRSHLLKCLETGTIVPFPVKKTRRPVQRISKIECFEVFCYCRLPDDGREMACCDKCEEWYHMDCLKINNIISKNEEWFCNFCR